MGQVVYGLASGENQAETIVQKLYENGVPLDAVSVLTYGSVRSWPRYSLPSGSMPSSSI